MLEYLKKIFLFSKGQAQPYRLAFLLALLLLSFMASGCNLTSSKERYENLEFGISLEKPTSWSVEFYERNGSIVLEAKKGIWNKDSAHVEIDGYACNITHSNLLNIDKGVLEADIRRIRLLYDLDSVTVLQEPTIIENEKYRIGTAIIQIPTEALKGNPNRNHVGQGADIFQTVKILAIKAKDKNAAVMAYIYKGNSEELNTEAQDIVDSIELICVP